MVYKELMDADTLVIAFIHVISKDILNNAKALTMDA